MKLKIVLIGVWLFSSFAQASDLYRDDVTYFTLQDQARAIERLSAIESPSERDYLTQIALEKPAVFLRQVRVAHEALADGVSLAEAQDALREAGFYSPAIQEQLAVFLSGYRDADSMTESDINRFVLHLNDPEGYWDHLFSDDLSLDPFAGLECAPEQIPTELMGPPEHQYVMRVAHPNMEMTLWRYEPKTAIRYPVAVVSQTTVDRYQLMSRLGQPMATLNRQTLEMQTPDGSVVCRKVAASIMHAFQNHRRELVLSEKQL